MLAAAARPMASKSRAATNRAKASAAKRKPLPVPDSMTSKGIVGPSAARRPETVWPSSRHRGFVSAAGHSDGTDYPAQENGAKCPLRVPVMSSQSMPNTCILLRVALAIDRRVFTG